MALTAVSVSEWREDEEKQTDTLTSPLTCFRVVRVFVWMARQGLLSISFLDLGETQKNPSS